MQFGKVQPVIVAAVLLAGALAGCGGSEETAPRSALVPIPEADLSKLEPAAQEQLREGRRLLETSVGDPALSDETLSLVYGEAGRLFQAYGLLEAAGACYANAERLAPAEFRWPYYLGHVNLGLGKPKDAALAFGRALERQPGYAPALAHLARLEQHGTVPAEIDDPLMAELERLKGDWRVHQSRGTTLFEEGRYQEAVVEFRTAAEGAPGEATTLTNLGAAYAKLGNEAAAIEAFQGALRLEPNNVMAHFNLGTLQAARGDDPQAVEHFNLAIAIDAGHLPSHLNLANSLRRLGRHEEAVAHYRRMVEGEPGNGPARLGESLALIRLHRYKEARDRLEEARTVLPDDKVILNVLVRVLAAAPDDGVRDGKRALELARTLLDDQGPTLQDAVAFAMAAAEARDFPLALEWQGRAIAAAERLKAGELLPEMRENQARYQRGEACRRPWRDDDPVLSPRA